MAATTLSSFTSVLASWFEDRIATQLNRSVPLMQLLPVTPGQGKNIQWVVRTGTDTGAAIADGANVSAFNSDDKTPAVLQWAVYHDAFQLSGLAYHGAAAAKNPAELASLFTEELWESVTRLAQVLGTHVYNGNSAASPPQMAGLVTATTGALLSTGTYATINKSSVAQFQGNEMLNGGIARPLTIPLLREMRRRIYIASGEKPDLLVGSPIQHERYGQLLANERRYIQDVRLRGQKISLDGGYQALEFDGIPFVEDKNCPDDKVLFLNTECCHLKHLPSNPDAVNQAKANTNLHGTPEEQFGANPVPFSVRIQPLAILGDSFPFALYCYCQLQVKRPNSCGILGDLQV